MHSNEIKAVIKVINAAKTKVAVIQHDEENFAVTNAHIYILVNKLQIDDIKLGVKVMENGFWYYKGQKQMEVTFKPLDIECDGFKLIRTGLFLGKEIEILVRDDGEYVYIDANYSSLINGEMWQQGGPTSAINIEERLICPIIPGGQNQYLKQGAK